MPIPAMAIPAAMGVAQTVTGLIKSGKAKREAERLRASRPKLGASEFLDDQLSLAQSELANGMSAGAETAYEEGLSRDVSSSLDAILKGGGDVNNVAEIFDRSNTGRQRLALMKENLRLSQINNLVNAQTASENQRQQMFQFNEWAPWSDAVQANAQARQGAENMIWGGIQTVGNAATGFLQGQQNQKALGEYFNAPGSGTPNYTAMGGNQTPRQVSNGMVASPGANVNSINPNFNSNRKFDFNNLNTIDDSLFYPSEMY